MELRLSVLLARSGVASRRKSDDLIQNGDVTVNGKVETSPGRKVIFGQDHVKVRGKLITKLAPLVYLIFNKPAGCVTTADDPEGRKTVFDYIKKIKTKVEPVGRLDFDTEGLLIFTNDGDMAFKLSRPETKVPKTYKVKVKGRPSNETYDLLRDGITLDGKKTLPAKIKRVKATEGYTWIRITITEGKYRQVRRMLEKVQHPAVRLRREKYGPLELEGIPAGKFRFLRPDEIVKLREAIR